MELKLQDLTAKILSLARDQRLNQNTIGTFFNTLEKVTTENDFLTHLGPFSILTQVA